jgi:MFS transporter, FSR family, fosmidomycin resistance protein
MADQALWGRLDPVAGGRTVRPGRVLFVASALHVCNDAFFAVLYPILPLIAADLGLSYGEVGLIKTVFSGSAAALQLPAGMLAERWGEYGLLAWGNAWVAVGLLGMAAANGFLVLLGAALLGGLGGNAQHPLAAALVARAYGGGRRATAIGTLNFAGDLGKMAAPALVTLAVALGFGWRATLVGLGLFGLVFSALVGLARAWVRPPPLPGRAEHDPAGEQPAAVGAAPGGPGAAPDAIPAAYWLLAVVGMLDATTRAAALTFLPFALEGRGLGAAEVSLLFGLLFAGGAAGKFLCGLLGDRFGPFAVVLVTELATAAALLGLLRSPLAPALVLAVVFGFALNGTSSVLYAAVAALVPEGKRGRGYGLYYTGTQSAAALAPLAYGVVADHVGLSWTFLLMAGLTVLVVPLATPIRQRLVG